MYLTANEISVLREQIVKDKSWEKMLWGTFGREGNLPLRYLPLHLLETEHLENILITEDFIPTNFKIAIIEILKIRHKETII